MQSFHCVPRTMLKKASKHVWVYRVLGTGPSWFILRGIGISECLFVFIKCCIGARSGDTESWSQLVYSLRYWYLRVFVCLHQMLYWCQVWGYRVLGTLVPAGFFSEVLVSQGVCLSSSNAVLVPGLGIQSLDPSWFILWGIGISGCLFVFIKCFIKCCPLRTSCI